VSAEPLRLIHISEIGAPLTRAVRDLDAYAGRLQRVARDLPTAHHALALDLLSDWRMYCCERNLSRWPEGGYYLLDRSYSPWRHHHIAFTADELKQLGANEWDRRVIRVASAPTIVPLQADCFHHTPRRHLARFSEMVVRIAEYLDRRGSLAP